jgi:hypothetical protein
VLGRIKKSFAAIAVTLLATMGILIGGASTASAADLSDCRSGYACLYDGAGHTGSFALFASFISYLGNQSMDNKATSLYNNGNSCTASFYQLATKKGHRLDLEKGYVMYNLENYRMTSTESWNNRITSGYFCQ